MYFDKRKEVIVSQSDIAVLLKSSMYGKGSRLKVVFVVFHTRRRTASSKIHSTSVKAVASRVEADKLS
jgi:hypothetical protein